MKLPFTKIGNLHCFWFNSENIPYLCIGPHWKFYVGLILSIILAALVFIFIIAATVSTNLMLLTAIVYGSLIINYTLAVILNPGIAHYSITKLDISLDENTPKNYCPRCEA